MKIQQPKKPEIRTKVDFLFERANILSKKPARKIGQKIKKKPTFEDKPWPKLVKNSQFLGQRWDHRSPYHLSTLGPCSELFSSCLFNSPSGVRPCGELFSSRSFNFNSTSGVTSFGELFSSSSFNFNSPSRNRPFGKLFLSRSFNSPSVRPFGELFWAVHVILHRCGELFLLFALVW